MYLGTIALAGHHRDRQSVREGGVYKGRETVPDSWRRYAIWSVIGARIAFICSVLALPLCIWALLVTLADGSSDAFFRFVTLASHESLSRLVDWGMATGLGLTLFAVLISGAVLWLRPGIDPAPRLAWWALTVGSIGLALHIASLLVALAWLFRADIPAS
jgi:hypothetical protein